MDWAKVMSTKFVLDKLTRSSGLITLELRLMVGLGFQFVHELVHDVTLLGR